MVTHLLLVQTFQVRVLVGQRDDRFSDDNVITEQKKPTIEARFRLWVFCVMYLAKRELNLFPLSKNQVHRVSQSEGGIPGSEPR